MLLCIGVAFIGPARLARAQDEGTDPAADEDPDEAEYWRLVDEAIAHSSAARFHEALALFLRAHALRPSARTLRGIGLMRFELGDYAQAIPVLTQALDDPRRPLDEEARAEVRERRDRAMGFVAQVELVVRPEDATVSVDGRPLVREGGVALFNPGRHHVSIEREGHRAQELVWVFDGGERRRVEVALTPVGSATPDTVAAPAVPPGIPVAVRTEHEGLWLHVEPFGEDGVAGEARMLLAPSDERLPAGRYRLGVVRGLSTAIDVGPLELREPVQVDLSYDDRDGLRIAGWVTFAGSILVPTILWILTGPVDGVAADTLGVMGVLILLVSFPTSMVLVGFNDGASVRIGPPTGPR